MLSKQVGQRPSSLLGKEVSDYDWLSWCLDNAVIRFGTSLEVAMQEAAAGTSKPQFQEVRRQQVMARWLDLPDSVRFRDPAKGD